VDGGRSLLAAGIVAVEGSFASGDVVALTTGNGRPFARGLVNYPADELRRIVGLKTDRIATVLGSVPYEEVIHRDNLAIVSREDAAC
jgi:glutamate 5-kinase